VRTINNYKDELGSMKTRNRKNVSLSDDGLTALKGIVQLSGKVGFPEVDCISHAIDIAAIELYEQIKNSIDGDDIKFLTVDKWQ